MCLGRWFSWLWAGEERARCGLVSWLETAVLIPDVLAQAQSTPVSRGAPCVLVSLSHDGHGRWCALLAPHSWRFCRVGLVTQAAFPLRGRDSFLLFLLILSALLISVKHPLTEPARPELATCHGC